MVKPCPQVPQSPVDSQGLSLKNKQTNRLELHADNFGEWQLEMHYRLGEEDRKEFLEDMALTEKVNGLPGGDAKQE